MTFGIFILCKQLIRDTVTVRTRVKVRAGARVRDKSYIRVISI